jgi:hypothetical protein
MPDLHEEFALVRKLQYLVILLGASAQPDVVFVVDEDSVLRGRPFPALARTTPGLEELSVRVELDDRWGGNTALRLWGLERGTLLAIRNGRWAVEDPDVVVGIDSQPADLAGYPLIWQRLRPKRIRFK